MLNLCPILVPFDPAVHLPWVVQLDAALFANEPQFTPAQFATLSGWVAIFEQGPRAVLLYGVDDPRPPRPDWYLAYLAVEPAHQRQGLGSLLLRHLLDSADRARANVECNASDAGKELYARHGFHQHTSGARRCMRRRPQPLIR